MRSAYWMMMSHSDRNPGRGDESVSTIAIGVGTFPSLPVQRVSFRVSLPPPPAIRAISVFNFFSLRNSSIHQSRRQRAGLLQPCVVPALHEFAVDRLQSEPRCHRLELFFNADHSVRNQGHSRHAARAHRATEVAGGKHVCAPYEAWIAADPFRGGFRVLITGPQGFERTVTFAIDDDPAAIRRARAADAGRLSRCTLRPVFDFRAGG
jgi:hypothetical protein